MGSCSGHFFALTLAGTVKRSKTSRSLPKSTRVEAAEDMFGTHLSFFKSHADAEETTLVALLVRNSVAVVHAAAVGLRAAAHAACWLRS